MSDSKSSDKNFSRRKFIKTGVLVGGAAVVGLAVGLPSIAKIDKPRTISKPQSSLMPAIVEASYAVPGQVAVDGATITKYVDPLPTFVGARVDASKNPTITVNNMELQQKILPATFYAGLAAPFKDGTYVWGYSVTAGKTTKGPLYPAFTIEAKRNVQAKTTYVNSIKTPYLQRYLSVDQTVHWANPTQIRMDDPTIFMQPYSGLVPVVTHLHGGEVPSSSDGGPDAWFTPDYALKGPAWNQGVTKTYIYPNKQEATTLFYHDHVLGATRINLYAGLVGFYFIRDQFDTGVAGKGLNLPAGPYEIELAIQDKMFDVNGQLLFPDGSGQNAPTANTPNGPADGAGFNGPPPNPSIHPFWIPEFFGDIILVNGKSWPYLNVEPRRYRFRIVDGANARFFNLTIPGLKWWIIGTDGGLLDKPVASDALFLAPGERADVIVDFSSVAGNQIIMTNDAVTPYPSGGSGPGQDPGPAPATSTSFENTVGQIMKFVVGTTVTGGKDKSFNPAASGVSLRGRSRQPPAIVRLADGLGSIATEVKIDKKRMLTLVEVEGPGGPINPLVNNTGWKGLRSDDVTPIPDFKLVNGNYLSETPQVGSTEQWDIVNMTADAHPIHLHLVQFQLINRQNCFVGTNFDADPQTNDPKGYRALYDSKFPSGKFEPNNGPPLSYFVPNAAGAIGGNPDVTPFLTGPVQAPLSWEVGWKDTFKMFPGQMTRIIVRWAPQDLKINEVAAGQNKYTFDPTKGPGYVWHCHIVDHEDNEMMRPYIPIGTNK